MVNLECVLFDLILREILVHVILHHTIKFDLHEILMHRHLTKTKLLK